MNRRTWFSVALAACLAGSEPTSPLTPSFDGDNLYANLPHLHFLTGGRLDRLRGGNTLVLVSRLTIFSDDRRTVWRQAPERITVSYDLWEETFRIALHTANRRASSLSAAAAESWCLDNLSVSALGLPRDRPFWFQLELHTVNPRELTSIFSETGISISNLIELLSRKPADGEDRWTAVAGPFKLVDLPRTLGHRT